MSETENKKNASERLTDLENSMAQVGQAFSTLEAMYRDLQGLKEALKLLNNKVNALARAGSEGKTPTDELLSQYMTETNAAELKEKVQQMVSSGLLISSDTAADGSFVVISESDSSGKVVNPRMQFLLSSLQHEEVRTKLTGAKVGDTLPVGTEGASITLLESYTIQTPQAATAEATATAETPAPAAEATPSAAPATETTASA